MHKVKKMFFPVFNILGKIRLPFGKVGDGISKPHIEHMEGRIKKEFFPEFTKIENELEIAKAKAGESEEVLSLIEAYENKLRFWGKINRWLGYLQAIIVTNKGASLDEMKQVNEKI